MPEPLLKIVGDLHRGDFESEAPPLAWKRRKGFPMQWYIRTTWKIRATCTHVPR